MLRTYNIKRNLECFHYLIKSIKLGFISISLTICINLTKLHLINTTKIISSYNKIINNRFKQIRFCRRNVIKFRGNFLKWIKFGRFFYSEDCTFLTNQSGLCQACNHVVFTVFPAWHEHSLTSAVIYKLDFDRQECYNGKTLLWTSREVVR